MKTLLHLRVLKFRKLSYLNQIYHFLTVFVNTEIVFYKFSAILNGFGGYKLYIFHNFSKVFAIFLDFLLFFYYA